MHDYIPRFQQPNVLSGLVDFPAIAILGPRQCGKSTLARQIVAEFDEAVYLDLERPSDLRKLHDPELFLSSHESALVCLDEIQRAPELFGVLRSVIDRRRRPGQFLILGSASPELIRQGSQSLAGRLAFFELTPFVLNELRNEQGFAQDGLTRQWLRGGFPDSYLSRSDEASVLWRENFVRTFLERDIPQLGLGIPAESLRRLWTMLAHLHGQLLNSSRLGESLGVSHTTVRSYIDLLSQTFMVRVLPPLEANLKKRLVKSPKVFLRDTGILHSLLQIDDTDELMSHPVYGASWEGFVIENVLAVTPRWTASFFRTSNGAELDLVLSRGRQRLAIECKASSAPRVTRGFWNSLEALGIDEAWIVAPVSEPYAIRKGVTVTPLAHLLDILTDRS